MNRETIEAAALAALGQACHECAHQWCQSERAAAGRILQLEPNYRKALAVDIALGGTKVGASMIEEALRLRDVREAAELAA